MQTLLLYDRKAFSALYEQYWERLYVFARKRVDSEDEAFNLVQELFVRLWAQRESLKIEGSIETYLFQALRHNLVNHFKKAEVRARYAEEIAAFMEKAVDNSTEETVELHALEEAVEKSIRTLPERCQQIFRLSRLQHKTIPEISTQLNISHKTVENQLTLALKHLRVSLGEFMVLSLIFV